MTPFDPTDIDFAAAIKSERIERDNQRVRLVNLALLLLIVVALALASSRIGIIPEIKKILLPILSVLFPICIARLYPVNTQPLLRRKQNDYLLLRLNAVGVPFVILLLNIVYFNIFGWTDSLVCVFVASYALAAMLAFRPIYSMAVDAPSNWSNLETLLKATVLATLVIILGSLFGYMPVINALLSENKNLLCSFLALTVLIPFYIGIAIARLPVAKSSLTHGFTKNILLEKFQK
jgi:hypothetical protein